MKAPVYDIKTDKKEDKTLKDKVFGLEINQPLLSEVAILMQSNLRIGIAKTKTRGEISGGGKKPWKQKGTGRARTGSIRNPIWRGGGTTFGPTGEQNFKKLIPIKKRKASLLNALSLKAKEKQIIIIKEVVIKEPKTKVMAEVLAKLPISGKILMVLPEHNEVFYKSGRNIENLKMVVYKDLNTLEVLLADFLILVNGVEAKLEGLALSSTPRSLRLEESKSKEPALSEPKGLVK